MVNLFFSKCIVVCVVHSSLSPLIPSVHRGSIWKEVRSCHPEPNWCSLVFTRYLCGELPCTIGIPFSIKFVAVVFEVGMFREIKLSQISS